MITKINSLQQIGNFDEFNWGIVPHFNKINMIFGYNGSGKTTISNVFRLYSRQREDEDDALFKELANRADANVEITFDNHALRYSKGCEKKDIYVFNPDFIAEHVFDGTKLNCKEFDSSVVTEEQLKNPKIRKLEAEIQSLQDEKSAEESKKAELDKKFNEIKENLSTEFNSKVMPSRLPSIQIPDTSPIDSEAKIRSDLNSAYHDYKLSQMEQELGTDITSLNALSFEQIGICIGEVSRSLSRNIQEDSRKKIQEKIDGLKDFVPKNTTINEWFENGFLILKHKKSRQERTCPLCNSDLKPTIDKLIDDYQAFFSDEYSSLLTDIDKLIIQIDSDLANIDKNKTNAIKLASIENKYPYLVERKEPLNNSNLKGNQKAADGIDDDNIKTILKEIKDKLLSKKANVAENKRIFFDSHKKIIDNYNSRLNNLRNRKNNLISELAEKSRDPNTIVQSIRKLCVQLAHASFDDYDTGNQIVNYKTIKENIEKTETNIRKQQTERNKEIAKLKSESHYVNSYLKQLGIYHFEIVMRDDIHVQFEGGITKSTLRHSLSESEKTTLAFAYFLSKIQYEIMDNTNAEIEDTIIVIDDPISSLDENRLHVTACLIKNLFQDAQQLFILSHNLIFMKFLNNVLGNPKSENKDGEKESCRQDYYLSNAENKLLELPNELKNYKTTYFQRIDELIKYRNGEIPYERAKKFIPNYIRIILETFLSFKFYILTQGSSDNKYRTPGLDRLANELKNKTHLFRDFESVGDISAKSIISKLEQIKRITDPQSHGSPQDIDDVPFISEAELNNTTKDTLNIIRFLDRIHLDEIVDH